jgi:isopenicillin-N epimerase
LLDPDVVFLNHGSFGACPRPVFEEYQRWQRELERQPVEFLARRYPKLVEQAKTPLAAELGARPDDLVFVPNATAGMNVVARSLELGPGDEVLATTDEYGAVDYLWEYVCGRTGATFVRHSVESGPMLVDDLWAAVTPRTRAISVSHITSATALRFPVEEICRRARAEGLLAIVDGAHAPGQVAVDLASLGADFYSGNCHKKCVKRGVVHSLSSGSSCSSGSSTMIQSTPGSRLRRTPHSASKKAVRAASGIGPQSDGGSDPLIRRSRFFTR